MFIACTSRRPAISSAASWHGPDASLTNCNPTDIYKYIVPHPATTGPPSQLTPLHQQRSWARAIQQDFQRTNVYWKASTLITNITQPSLNNPKLPPKFQRQDNNHVHIPNIHPYKHIPLLRPLNLDPLIMTSNKNTSMISTRVH